MEKAQDIYCLKTSKRLFGLSNPTGDNIVFVFTDEAGANKFIDQLSLYAPELTISILKFSTFKELRAFLLQNPMFIHVNPFVEISLAKNDFQEATDSFLVRLCETTTSCE